MRLTRAQGILVMAALAVFAIGGAGFTSMVGTVDTAAHSVGTFVPVEEKPIPTEEFCLNARFPRYFANVSTTAKERPWSFGPPATVRSNYDDSFKPITDKPNRTAVQEELIARLCGNTDGRFEEWFGGDKALYAAITSVIDDKDPNRTISLEEWTYGVEYLVREGGFAFSRARIEHRSENGTGYSLHMKPSNNKDNAPRIGASKLRPVSSWYYILPVIRPEGSEFTLELRLDCGFQPRVAHRSQLPQALRAQV